MNMEQAKEVLDDNVCIIENYHFNEKEIEKARSIAIKSLDMWDKVTDELEELRYNGDFKITYSACIKRVLDIIERYKKEIEE